MSRKIKQTLSKALISAALLSQSPFIMADYRSSIGGIDLGVVYNPPTNIGPIVCEQYMRDPDTGADDSDLLMACQMGVNAARWMAEKYAQGDGRFLGCLDGMMQGVDRGFNANKNPSARQLDEARARYENLEMPSARTRAQRQAQDDGQAVADSKIIERFRQVVGTGRLPDPTYTYPDHNFNGFNNGFDYDNRAGSFQNVYDAGWVTSSDSLERRIQARAIYELHNANYSPSNLCRAGSVLIPYLPMTLWDYFQQRRDHDFQQYGWRNVNRALNYFLNDVTGTTEKLFYLNIQGKREQYIERVLVRQAEYDADGNLIREAEYRDEIREREVPGRGKDYYQRVYRDVFRLAYDEYYRTQYFGKAFVEAHQQFREVGETIGAAIGANIAGKTADQLAYNARYREESIAAFNLEWRTNYDQQWNYIWSHFLNNSVVELNTLGLEGDVNDGIFRAGERLRAFMNVTNLGMQSDEVTFSMFGDLQRTASYNYSIPASSRYQLTTPFMASIDSTLMPRQRAQVGVSVRGAVDFDTQLTTQRSENLLIRDRAEIDRASLTLNFMRGSGQLALDLINPSTIATSSTVELLLVLDHNLGDFRGQGLNLAGNETRRAHISLDGLDPLEVIRLGGISGSAMTLKSGRIVHEVRVSRTLDSRQQAMAQYFDALANDTNGQVNTGDDDLEGRTQEVINLILHLTRQDVSRGVNWNRSEAERTVVFQLAQQYQATRAAGRLTDRGAQLYAQLGSLLNSSVASDVRRGQRKEFRRTLQVFAPDVNVRKKARK